MRAALSVFWRSLQYWGDEIALLVPLNAAWLLAVLLIIPGPPATAALLTVTNRMAHGELVSWRIARDAFRRYFWKSWAWAAINLAFVGLLVFNHLYYSAHTSGTVLVLVRAMWAVMALVWSALQFYWFPLILEMPGHPIILALRNAGRLALLNPGFTVTLLIVVLLFTAISVALTVMMMLMWTSVLALVANHATLDRLAAYREMRALLGEEAMERASLEGIDRPAASPVITPRPPKRRPRRARQRQRHKSSKKATRG
ncbi:MAG: DUF624 domain-containing protein [Anaerolineae bacterium]|nr:DUF624 domain-containing protein [Anaerolineae bacterium]MDW8100179.1 DUF624 domain-containing protein [Anaerolineae bacterium]